MNEDDVDYSFERLLRALQSEKEDLIGALACDLFIANGEPNKVEIDAFEKYARCKIENRWIESARQFVGIIYYEGKKYYYG